MADIDFRSEQIGGAPSGGVDNNKILYISMICIVAMIGVAVYWGSGMAKLKWIDREITQYETYLMLPDNINLERKASQVRTQNTIIGSYNDQMWEVQQVLESNNMVDAELIRALADFLSEGAGLKMLMINEDMVTINVMSKSEQEIVEYTYKLQEYERLRDIQVGQLSRQDDDEAYPYSFTITCYIVQE